MHEHGFPRGALGQAFTSPARLGDYVWLRYSTDAARSGTRVTKRSRDFRNWHETDVNRLSMHVRFLGSSGHRGDAPMEDSVE